MRIAIDRNFGRRPGIANEVEFAEIGPAWCGVVDAVPVREYVPVVLPGKTEQTK
jgi:hypothetical protein